MNLETLPLMLGFGLDKNYLVIGGPGGGWDDYY